MNTETLVESITGFFKILYPLSAPVVTVDRVSKGKYKCIIYMRSFAVPARPWYMSSICNSKVIALKQMLGILEEALLVKFALDQSNSNSVISFAQAKIKELEFDIANAKRNLDYCTNTMKRLRYLKGKQL